MHHQGREVMDSEISGTWPLMKLWSGSSDTEMIYYVLLSYFSFFSVGSYLIKSFLAQWEEVSLPFFFFFVFSNVFYSIFIRYFLHLHCKCYPESSPYPPHIPCCYPPTPTSWPWRSPVLGHIKFARPRVLSSQWWPTRPFSSTYAARDTSSGWYWLVHIVVPPKGLQTPSVPWVISLAPPLHRGPCVPSSRWLWASTSVFARQ